MPEEGPAHHNHLIIPQWGVGLILALVGAAVSGTSAYWGSSSAASPEVVGFQIEQLGRKVDQLHQQVGTLDRGMRDMYLTRDEFKRELEVLHDRFRRLEDQER